MEGVAETAALLGVEDSIGRDHLVIGHATKDFIAGAISGMVGICAGQPLDTVRIRLQQQGCRQASATALWRAMGATDGARGLFRGLSYPLSTIALQNAVCFQAQGAAARVLTGSDSRTPVSWQHTALSGLFAGAVSSFITSPVELLKIRMQVQAARPGAPDYMGAIQTLRQVVRHEGVAGLAGGLGITLARDTPSYAFYFVIYHWTCQGLGRLLYPGPAQLPAPQGEAAAMQHAQHVVHQHLEHLHEQRQQQHMQEGAAAAAAAGSVPGASQPLVQFLAGGCAGALAWASIYPIDVVKSRMQAHPRAASPYTSAWQCAGASWAAEGPRVFVKGLGATMVRGFVVNAAIFAAFEALMRMME